MYKQAYDEIQGYLMEGRYTISRLRLLTGSPEAVQVQVENLEVLIFLSVGHLIYFTISIITVYRLFNPTQITMHSKYTFYQLCDRGIETMVL